jgi:hypothetical protein
MLWLGFSRGKPPEVAKGPYSFIKQSKKGKERAPKKGENERKSNEGIHIMILYEYNIFVRKIG